MTESFPDDPRDLLAPFDVAVDCDGCRHVVRWERRGVVSHVHDDADRVVEALGGDTNACFSLAQAWTDPPPKRPVGYNPKAHLAGTPLAASVLHDMSLGDADEVAGRVSPSGAMRLLLRRHLSEWLTGLGATGPFQLDVGVYAADTLNDPDGENPPPIGGRAEWCDAVGTHATVMVSTRWWDDVRTHGLIVDGRFNLGAGRDGQLVVLTPTVTGAGRPAAWGTHLTAPAVALDALRAAAAAPVDAALCVAGFCRWENDDFDGVMVRQDDTLAASSLQGFPSAAAAAMWVAAANVYETYMGADPALAPMYYPDGLAALANELFDDQNADPALLLEHAARTATDPADLSVPWTEWSKLNFEEKNG